MSILDIFRKNDTSQNGIDGFLPNNLQIDSLIQFDELEFSNIGLNSKFIFEDFNNTVQAVGIYEVNEKKHVNIYLESQREIVSYLTIVYDEKDKGIESCRLFKLYDEVFPQSEEEWLYWIGNENVQGIMNEETFIIEDEPMERVGELLFKLTRKLYPEFKGFMDCSFEDYDSCLSTDLFSKIADELEIGYDEVIAEFDKYLSECDWIVEIIKNDEDEKIIEIYFILTESDLDIEYSNYYQLDDATDYDEKIYSDKNDENPVIVNKKSMIFHRKIDDEQFNEEYININVIEDGQGTHIALDIGIPIPVSAIIL